jgi:hypothetical protein
LAIGLFNKVLQMDFHPYGYDGDDGFWLYEMWYPDHGDWRVTAREKRDGAKGIPVISVQFDSCSGPRKGTIVQPRVSGKLRELEPA